MEIKHIPQDESRGYFSASVDGEQAGTASYFFRDPETVVVDHVIVEPRMEGKGIGRALVMATAEWARENGLGIVPWCSFARRIYQRVDAIRDLVRK